MLPSSQAGLFGPYNITSIADDLHVFRWVYTLVQNHIRHLDGVSQETDELAAEAIEDLDEEAPLLRPPSPVGQNQT